MAAETLDRAAVHLNTLSEEPARAALERCCGAHRWVEGMLARRPFASGGDLAAASETVWGSLGHDDWLEAFSHHPKIGDVEGLRRKFASTATWAAGEQAGVSAATEDVLARLAAGNEAYERRFGYIFIVCATGKTAGEMLALLEARLGNPPEVELAIAAGEQAKITRIRLEKLEVP